jgi:hypothetical protein
VESLQWIGVISAKITSAQIANTGERVARCCALIALGMGMRRRMRRMRMMIRPFPFARDMTKGYQPLGYRLYGRRYACYQLYYDLLKEFMALPTVSIRRRPLHATIWRHRLFHRARIEDIINRIGDT